ncbi:AAA family ATPase [Oceanobacillus sp. CFH 90083]|uniref:phosphotransferase-like protein n=1 Tax=Oceanobacillus sp. CFH 90083 TaxID=2592336 RepID=UPI00128CA725
MIHFLWNKEVIKMTLPKGIYIITGMMASGKSTVAQLLAEQLDNSVHVHGDIYRKMIVNGRKEMTAEPSEEALAQLRLRYHLTANTVKAYYEAGFSVVVQDNYLGKETNTFLQEFQSQSIYFITLNPSMDVIVEREMQRNKTGYHSWQVEPLYQVFVEENPQIGLWIDSSVLTPEETVAEILKRVETEGRIGI